MKSLVLDRLDGAHLWSQLQEAATEGALVPTHPEPPLKTKGKETPAPLPAAISVGLSKAHRLHLGLIS